MFLPLSWSLRRNMGDKGGWEDDRGSSPEKGFGGMQNNNKIFSYCVLLKL